MPGGFAGLEENSSIFARRQARALFKDFREMEGIFEAEAARDVTDREAIVDEHG